MERRVKRVRAFAWFWAFCLVLFLIAGGAAADSAQPGPVEIGLRAYGAGASSPASPPVIDFGPVTPARSPYIKPLAFQLSVSSPLSWSVSIRAAGDFTEASRGASIPCSRLKWRPYSDTLKSWFPLTLEDTVARNGPAGENIPVAFDLRLDVPWEDPPGTYSTEIVVSLAPSGAIALSTAVPNPFSPNGDGVKDATTITFNAASRGRYAGDIRDMSGALVARFFESSDALSPGWYSVTWDGRNEGGSVVSDGKYAFNINSVDPLGYERTVCSGTLVVDTLPPPLAIDSPQGSEVGSTFTLSGTTEPEITVYIRLNGKDLTTLVADSSGAFSANLNAVPGQNTLEVIAEDHAGNRTQVLRTLTNNSAVVISSLSDGQTVRSRLVSVAGRGPVSSPVTLHINGKPSGDAQSDPSGVWLIPQVALAPGENLLIAKAVNPRGEEVESEPLVVRYDPATGGSAGITGTVKEASTGLKLAGAEVVLMDGSEAILARTKTDAEGRYGFSGLRAGAYKLSVSLVNYRTQTTPLMELAEGEMLSRDFELERNIALKVTKSADVSQVETGEYVVYTITVQNLLSSEVSGVRVRDYLPLGMSVLRRSTTLNGTSFADPGGYDPAVWELGTLGPRESFTLRFKAAIGHNAPKGEAVNRAITSAKTPYGDVEVGPAEATVKVTKGIFRDGALVFGSVWLDLNSNGIRDGDEPGLPGAVVLLEDGTSVTTDGSGAYSLPSVRPGVHVLRLRRDTIPDGFKLLTDDRTPIRVMERGTHRRDFALVPVNGNGNGVKNNIVNGNGNGYGSETARIKRIYGMEEPLMLISLGEATVSRLAAQGNLEMARAVEGFEDEVKFEGNLALYLKAKVKGEALITAGVDLRREDDGDPIIEPEKYYPVYGDDSRISDLPYGGPLYVAVDYKGFHGMYGRFGTDFMTGELGGYPRTLPGVVLRYTGDRVSAAAFDSVTKQVMAREEFPADGTSGPFYLKHLPMVRNTETVKVITTDKLDPGKVIRERSLVRDVDYVIDPQAGRIVLTEPLWRTDEAGNPNAIVVTYEFEPLATDVKHHIKGAHLSLQPYPGLRIGGQYLFHSQEPEPFIIASIFGSYSPTTRTTISGEYARSQGDLEFSGLSSKTGSDAYTLRLRTSPLDGFDVSAHYTRIDPGFENPARSIEDDVAEYGVETTLRLRPDFSITGSYSSKRDNVLKTPGSPTTCESTSGLRLRYVMGPSMEAGLAYTFGSSQDDLEPHGTDRRSHTWEVSLAKDFGSPAVTTSLGLSFSTEEDLASSETTKTTSQHLSASGSITDNLDATARLVLKQTRDEVSDEVETQNAFSLGLDYRVNDHLNASARAEFPVFGSDEGSTTLGVGLDYRPKEGLQLGAKYDKAIKEDKSLLVLSATGRVSRETTLGARYTWEKNSGSSYTSSIEAGASYRPYGSGKLAIFCGFGLKDSRNENGGIPETKRSISGRIEGCYKVSEGSRVSARYMHRLTEEVNGSEDASLITQAMTLGGVKDISDRWDVGGFYTVFLQNAEDDRKQVYGVELGYKVLEGMRLSIGIKRSNYENGLNPNREYDVTRVYLGIGYSHILGF